MTFNPADFPAEAWARCGIETQHPEHFISHLLNLAPGALGAVVKRQRESLHHPANSVEELVTSFERQGLGETVIRLRAFVDLI